MARAKQTARPASRLPSRSQDLLEGGPQAGSRNAPSFWRHRPSWASPSCLDPGPSHCSGPACFELPQTHAAPDHLLGIRAGAVGCGPAAWATLVQTGGFTAIRPGLPQGRPHRSGQSGTPPSRCLGVSHQLLQAWGCEPLKPRAIGCSHDGVTGIVRGGSGPGKDDRGHGPQPHRHSVSTARARRTPRSRASQGRIKIVVEDGKAGGAEARMTDGQRGEAIGAMR